MSHTVNDFAHGSPAGFAPERIGKGVNIMIAVAHDSQRSEKNNFAMERDGINKSLWQGDADFQSKALTDPFGEYDVAIVGGGMTGIVTGLLLQQAGKRCVVLESYNLGFGTTGGTTAHLNTLLDTPYPTITKNFNEKAARTVATAASEAIKLIEKNIADFGIDCEFERSDAYMFSQNENESDELEEIGKYSSEAGLSVNDIHELPIPAVFQRVKRFGDQAKFHPIKYLSGVAQALEQAGGHICEQCHVHNVSEDGDRLIVETSRGKVVSKKVIYATHIPPGVNWLHLRCAPWRSYAMALKIEGEYPEGLIYDMKDPYHYYRSQRIDDEMYLIVGGEDHKTGEDINTESCFRKLQAHAQGIFPVTEVSYKWSAQYFESTDGLPYIGVLPGNDGTIYVATGYGGNGMIHSHIAARELAEQIVAGKSLFDDLFSPSRVKPIAGFTNFINHNAHVIKEFVGKYVVTEELESLADIAPNEGKVVEVNGKPVAVSKSKDGKLYAVSSVCTHMKCNVVWNSAERSWDCPCHGARYAPDGKVITGPASHDLEPVRLTDMVKA